MEIGYPIRVLGRGLDLLMLFTSPGRPIRINDASLALGTAPSTTHRLMAMLISRDLVRQDPKTRGYYAGTALLDLAQNLLEEPLLVRAAQEELKALVQTTHETALIAVLRGSEAHVIASSEHPGLHTVTPERLPRVGISANTSAGGKALLAELSRTEFRRLFTQAHISAKTLKSITRRSTLERELVEVRRHGFAMSFEEEHTGLRSIALPIRDTTGKLYGALCLLSPVQRMPAKRIPSLVANLRASAKRIATRLEGALL